MKLKSGGRSKRPASAQTADTNPAETNGKAKRRRPSQTPATDHQLDDWEGVALPTTFEDEAEERDPFNWSTDHAGLVLSLGGRSFHLKDGGSPESALEFYEAVAAHVPSAELPDEQKALMLNTIGFRLISISPERAGAILRRGWHLYPESIPKEFVSALLRRSFQSVPESTPARRSTP